MSSDHASSLSLKRASHDGSTTALPAARNDLVDEIDEVIGESYCDLLAHTKMVPEWDQSVASPEADFERATAAAERNGPPPDVDSPDAMTEAMRSELI